MKGLYSLDFPEGFDFTRDMQNLDVSDIPATKTALVNLIRERYLSVFGYEVCDANYLETYADFTLLFDTSASFPSVDAGAFLTTSFKAGDTPHTLAIRGRFPQQNMVEGGVRVTDITSASNHCLITNPIDITAHTSDGLGRREFLIDFHDCLKVFTKDSTDLSGTSANVGSLDRAGNLHYDTSGFIRAYISNDNGNTYQEITKLQRVTYTVAQTSIRLAFVNPTNVDVHLLSYTLMY
jgi:hypothetical protein